MTNFKGWASEANGDKIETQRAKVGGGFLGKNSEHLPTGLGASVLYSVF